MEAIAVALIGLVGNLGGVLLSHHLIKNDRKTKSRKLMAASENSDREILISYQSDKSLSKTAVLSFIAGIANLLLPGLFCIVAIIAGHRAIVNIKASNAYIQGIGFAKTGLILGYSGLAILICILPFIQFSIN